MNSLIFLLVIFNMILSLIIVIWNLYFFINIKENESWTKILYTTVGIGWLIRYILYFSHYRDFCVINPPVLILVTLTLLSIAVGSIVRVQRIIPFRGMIEGILWKSHQ